MATIESIRALANDNNLSASTNSLLKIIKDKQETLHQAIDSLSKLIADDRNDKARAKYLYFLTKVLSKNSSNISASQIIESFKTSIPEEGKREQHRRRRTGLILCLAAVSRAGLLSENLPILAQYVQTLFNITLEHPFHSPQVYMILVDMAKANIPDDDTFMDVMLPILKDTQSKINKDVNILFFWTAVGHYYPKVPANELLQTPLSKQYLEKYQNLLLDTRNFRPSIHPIWSLLAEIDHTKLISIVSDLWVPQYKEFQPCIAYASCVAVPKFSPEELIEFLSNESLFVSSLSYVADKLIIPVLQSKISEVFESNSDTTFSVLIALLSI